MLDHKKNDSTPTVHVEFIKLHLNQPRVDLSFQKYITKNLDNPMISRVELRREAANIHFSRLAVSFIINVFLLHPKRGRLACVHQIFELCICGMSKVYKSFFCRTGKR